MFFGNDEIVRRLQNQVLKGTLHHAHLFFGEPHIGKRTCALHLASLLETGKWEGEQKNFVDTMVWTKGSEEKSIGIESVREMRAYMRSTPGTSKKRLLIIDGAESLTPESQAALLKTTEEPGSYGIIIFITTNEESLTTPLLSRCEKWFFRKMSEGEIKEILKTQYQAEEKKAATAARLSCGRLGSALAYREETKGARAKQNPEKNTIIDLYHADKIGYAHTIWNLLKYETKEKQWNVNPQLYKKSVEFIVKARS